LLLIKAIQHCGLEYIDVQSERLLCKSRVDLTRAVLEKPCQLTVGELR
jgi:hypothetical protein